MTTGSPSGSTCLHWGRTAVTRLDVGGEVRQITNPHRTERGPRPVASTLPLPSGARGSSNVPASSAFRHSSSTKESDRTGRDQVSRTSGVDDMWVAMHEHIQAQRTTAEIADEKSSPQ